jgi:predicted ATPase
MIRLIEAKNYRSLKYISQPLGDFHVLVGANATGKTTFLDVVSFIADLVGNGVDYAINQRTQNYMDLTFGGKGGDIELAIELEIPKEERSLLAEGFFDIIRYEVRFGLNANNQEHLIDEERVLLINSSLIEKDNKNGLPNQKFPSYSEEDTIIVNSDNEFTTLNPFKLGQVEHIYLPERWRAVIMRYKDGETRYKPEMEFQQRISFKLDKKRSSLGNLPADKVQFPSSTWLKQVLIYGVQTFILDSQNIRQASSPGRGLKLKSDGSNLPWVIEDLQKRDMGAYKNWVEHVRTALPDIEEIIIIERPDDRHRYLKIRYDNGIEVPSWMVSDGTLLLLALTLTAYLPDFDGVYLIEEPENGIHPRAIETVFQSLSSVYNAQILLATHSPVILSMVELKDVLCFAKTSDGVTDIVRGDEHPMLKGWKGETNLSVLFAAGVLS